MIFFFSLGDSCSGCFLWLLVVIFGSFFECVCVCFFFLFFFFVVVVVGGGFDDFF